MKSASVLGAPPTVEVPAEGASSIIGFLGANSFSESSSYSSRSRRSLLRSRRREALRSARDSSSWRLSVDAHVSMRFCLVQAERRLTSDLARAIGELLDLFFGEHAQHDDEVETLLEALLCVFERFRVDETTVDLGPAGARRNALLIGLCGVSVR